MKFRSTTIRTVCISSIFLVLLVSIAFVVVRTTQPRRIVPAPLQPVLSEEPIASTEDRCGLTVAAPLPASVVTSSFIVKGTLAMGNEQSCRWTVFEGSAGRIEVRNPVTSELLAPVTPLTLEDDWMEIALAGGVINFAVPIALSSAYTGPGTLLLIEDDPSGESEVINTVMITIRVQ